MIKLNKPSIFELYKCYCKLHNNWGVVVQLPFDEDRTSEENLAAVKYNLPNWHEYWPTELDVVFDGIKYACVIFTCDTEEEALNVFKNQVRGDDGLPLDPTPGECYAYLISNEGVILSENT